MCVRSVSVKQSIVCIYRYGSSVGRRTRGFTDGGTRRCDVAVRAQQFTTALPLLVAFIAVATTVGRPQPHREHDPGPTPFG